MKTSRNIGALCLAMFVLILDSKTAIAGASEGITLCIQVVIPSVFPFLVISICLNSALSGRQIPILSPIGSLLRIPTGTEGILLTGLLGGYPVGAQCVTQAYRNGTIRKTDAERMLAFCSNAGPAFLFGIGSRLFSNVGICFGLWLIHILSAWIVGILTPGKQHSSAHTMTSVSISLPQAIKTALATMACICGWVVIFRVILNFLDLWFLWALPLEIQCLIKGILELSNGCCSLLDVTDPATRIVLFSVILSFGGICVTMQTYSVCSGLNCHNYLPGKIAQAAISMLLCMGFLFLLGLSTNGVVLLVISVVSIAICVCYRFRSRKQQKEVAFSG